MVNKYTCMAILSFRVESAVSGILDVIDQGTSGSTWIVKDDQKAYDYSDKVSKAFEVLSET